MVRTSQAQPAAGLYLPHHFVPFHKPGQDELISSLCRFMLLSIIQVLYSSTTICFFACLRSPQHFHSLSCKLAARLYPTHQPNQRKTALFIAWRSCLLPLHRSRRVPIDLTFELRGSLLQSTPCLGVSPPTA